VIRAPFTFRDPETKPETKDFEMQNFIKVAFYSLSFGLAGFIGGVIYTADEMSSALDSQPVVIAPQDIRETVRDLEMRADGVVTILETRVRDEALAEDIAWAIVRETRTKADYDQDIVARMVIVESWGTPTAVGPDVCMARDGDNKCMLWDNALGLGQVMPSVWMGTSDCPDTEEAFFSVDANISCMVKVYAYYKNECDAVNNCTLNRYWGLRDSTRHNEATSYVRKVDGV
jgi:hypothetical protein